MSTAKPIVYSLGSPFGITPCEAWAKGCGLELRKEGHAEFGRDPVAVWGQLRGAKEILAKSKHFYRLDHAYTKRLDHYRMTRNDFQPSKVIERHSDRWESLKKRYSVNISPWRKGKRVVVALSDPRTYEFFGNREFPDWVRNEIKKHTERPVVERRRDEVRPLSEDLKDAWCLVTYASNSVIESLLAGVPVFTLGPSIARPMGCSDLSFLEAPLYPENREAFFRHMAYCQFTKEEFGSGFAHRTADETWQEPNEG